MKVLLSVIGLYNYDNTLFDPMLVPSGVDKDVLIDNIFMEAGELPVLYPDVDIFKRFLLSWSTRKMPQWERLKRVIETQYDIIRNYDRTEEIESETSTSGSGTKTNTGTQTVSGSSETEVDDELERQGKTIETHSGGYTDTHSGGFSDTHSGKYADKHTGKYADTHTGGYNEGHTGTIADTGTETMHSSDGVSGSNTRTGSVAHSEAGTYTDTTTSTPGATETTTYNSLTDAGSKTGFNSSALQTTDQNVRTGSVGVSHSGTDKTTVTHTPTNRVNTDTYNSVKDDKDETVTHTITDHNTGNTKTFGDTVTRTYSSDKVERLYTDDKIEREYTNDKIEREYSDDTVEREYTNDKIETSHENDKDVRTSASTTNSTNTRTDNLTETATETGTGTESKTVHAYGNIGVTTSQQMLQSELDLIPQLDLYGTIVNDFIDAFCVAVY